MGLEKHARISEDAEARILEEAVESSYRKGGIHASIGEQEVSKETVMNKLHALEFPLLEPLKEKRKVPRLYSATQMLAAENRNRARLGELADMPVYSIPYPQIKKIAALKNHIWGL